MKCFPRQMQVAALVQTFRLCAARVSHVLNLRAAAFFRKHSRQLTFRVEKENNLFRYG